MQDIQRSLSHATRILSDVLDELPFPDAVNSIALALTEIEKVEGMLKRLELLHEFFQAHPEVNARREEALKTGESFPFDMPESLANKIEATHVRQVPERS